MSGRGDGHQVALIDTLAPWGIASKAGTSRFHVLAEQLCDLNAKGESG
jgi:hypothetical protein